MSKVSNISKYMIPNLGEILGYNLNKISNCWYKDDKNKLIKILIYEDDYLISNDTEYPEEIRNLPKDLLYLKLSIYCNKVDRYQYVLKKDILFKISFDYNMERYYYIFNNIASDQKKFNDLQIDSKKRKRSYSDDYDIVDEKIDWSKMVSASNVRNYLLNDPLLDWLNEYNVTSIYNNISNNIPNSSSKISKFKDYNIDQFTKHIMEQGNIFEKEVIKLLSEKVKIVQASESFQAREIRNFNYTKKLMKDGIPVIFQAVLHNYNNNTYGCPDLLVRSDYINNIFNQELLSEKELNREYYYVVVDIKHSTLHFNSDFVTLRNKDSVPAYKGQLYIYNQALGQIQDYNPMKAFILGKKWIHKSGTGTNFLEKLGTIDYNNFDSNYVDQTDSAIDWIKRVRSEGHKWKLLPLPSIPELYPNMTNERDGIWKVVKKELSSKLNEITELWMCGVKNRKIAHENKITSYKDERCCSSLLGFKGGKIGDTIDQIIEINRDDSDIICPKKVKLKEINTKLWRNINETSLELYLDFETMNSNLGSIFVEDNNIGYQDNQFIFQIGVGYEKNNKWLYKSFLAETHSLKGELKMINSFWEYIDGLMKKEGMSKCHFVHWTKAEEISYRKLRLRALCEGIILPLMEYLDLYDLFRSEPITINGSLNFSLKSMAKAMKKHKLIKTSWDSSNPCSNGLNAMLLAHKVYKDENIVDEKNVIMNNIIHYNEIDCKVLWEMIRYLRMNH